MITQRRVTHQRHQTVFSIHGFVINEVRRNTERIRFPVHIPKSHRNSIASFHFPAPSCRRSCHYANEAVQRTAFPRDRVLQFSEKALRHAESSQADGMQQVAANFAEYLREHTVTIFAILVMKDQGIKPKPQFPTMIL